MCEVYIYTDGSSIGNSGPGGYGTILKANGREKVISEGYQITTNNRMELLAVIKGLQQLKKSDLRVTIVSDSKYVVDSVEKGWLKNWVKKGFKGKKNIDLWRAYLKISAEHKVSFKWIKGHAGHPENERCDQLAVQAAQGQNLKKDEGFEKG